LCVILKVRCDETGTHRDAPMTCMGGYVFDEDGERVFTSEWARALEPFKARGIELFHANKCYSRKGEFSVIDEAEKGGLFTSLIALTRRTAKFGMVSGIKNEVFEKVMHRNKFQTFTRSKYTICALRSLTLIEQWADENKFDGKMLYLFESGNEHQGEANAMMETIKKDPKMRKAFRYENHDFLKKSLLPPLQAADMFLWLFQRWFSEGKQDPFLHDLLNGDGDVSHLYQNITELSLGMLALMNMAYGVKSNRKYQSQPGRFKKYTI
jgi:hypothetical protein